MSPEPSKRHGLEATAVFDEDAGELVVQQGSIARGGWAHDGTADGTYGRLHSELVDSGALVKAGENLVFAANTAFRSPSAAASVIHGRHANGTTDWKVRGAGLTYKEWEQSRLSGSADNAG